MGSMDVTPRMENLRGKEMENNMDTSMRALAIIKRNR